MWKRIRLPPSGVQWTGWPAKKEKTGDNPVAQGSYRVTSTTKRELHTLVSPCTCIPDYKAGLADWSRLKRNSGNAPALEVGWIYRLLKRLRLPVVKARARHITRTRLNCLHKADVVFRFRHRAPPLPPQSSRYRRLRLLPFQLWLALYGNRRWSTAIFALYRQGRRIIVYESGHVL